MAKRRNPGGGGRGGPFDGSRLLDELLERLFDGINVSQISDEWFTPQTATEQHSPLTEDEHKLYAEIVELGFREAIKRYHPDRDGGSQEKAAAINALRDKVRLLAGVKK
jgi:hypothetical protein